MAMTGEQSGLTEGLLALHNRNFVRDPNAPNSWAQKVVAEERIHLYYSQLGQHWINRRDDTVNAIEGWTPALDHTLDHTRPQSQDAIDANLKIFQQLSMHISSPEGPLERFLTPDGCSDPSYYARPALERTHIAFGSMESVGERQRRAQGSMEMVIQRKNEQKSQSDLEVVLR